MGLKKKILVYCDTKGRKYRFKRVGKDNIGCTWCRMSQGAMCDNPLKNPIVVNHVAVLSINSLCRKINGRIFKEYIMV